MPKLIIGLAGEMASGKDTVKKYLVKKYGANPYKFSSLVRDVLKIIHLPDSRENMNSISVLLRKNFGEDIFSKVTYEKIKKDNSQYIVIDGVRRPEDLEYIKDLQGFKFIYIESDLKNRYKRLIERGENPDDIGKSFDEFEKDHMLNTELQIRDLRQYADFVIENNGILEELYQKVDEIINKNK